MGKVKLFYSEQETTQDKRRRLFVSKKSERSSAPAATLELQSHGESVTGKQHGCS
jgi:hypothetical protein